EAGQGALHEAGLLLLDALEQDRVALGQPSALELVAAQQRHRQQVRETFECVACRVRRPEATLHERFPAGAGADPPAGALRRQTLEQLLPRASLLRRLHLHPLAHRPQLDEQWRAGRRGNATIVDGRARDNWRSGGRWRDGHDRLRWWRRGRCNLGRAYRAGLGGDFALVAQHGAQRRQREGAAERLRDRLLKRRTVIVVELVPAVGQRDELDERAQMRAQLLDVPGRG